MAQANFLEEWELHDQEIPAEDSSCEMEMNKNIIVSYKQMAICTDTTGKAPDILLGENIYEQWKFHKFINGWFWLPIQVRIFFSCYLKLSNELFHYKTNICTWAIILLLLFITLEESLNFVILLTLLCL